MPHQNPNREWLTRQAFRRSVFPIMEEQTGFPTRKLNTAFVAHELRIEHLVVPTAAASAANAAEKTDKHQ